MLLQAQVACLSGVHLHAAGPPEFRCAFGPVLQVWRDCCNAGGRPPMLLHTAMDPLSQLCKATICTGKQPCLKPPCCRLVSSLLLHDSFLHLVLNSAALFQLAPEAEAVLGYPTFAAVYLLSGLGASLATIAFSDMISVGASACIFGLIGALAGYLWRNRSVHQTGQQLGLVAAVCAFNLLAGSDHRTAVENFG